jgi:chemotaxis protein CheD
MNPYGSGLPVVYLKTGQVHVSETPAIVTTVLGSCVSAAMYSPRGGLGAICHGLMPKSAGCGGRCLECGLTHGSERFRYVYCSIRFMANRFKQLGVRCDEIRVKLFGGSDIFNPEGSNRGLIDIGHQNIEAARQALEAERLRLVATDVGGYIGRKIFFYTHKGDVLVKRLQKSEYEAETTHVASMRD